MKILISLSVLSLMLGCLQPAAADMVTVLSDDFSAGTIDAAHWNQLPLGLEGGTGSYSFDTTTNPGQLTIAGTAATNYWSGGTLESVATFASDQLTRITVDRVSLANVGSGARSALSISQGGGPYFLFAQNTEGAGNWRYNNNAAGSGSDAGFNSFGNDTGEYQIQLVYRPLSVTGAAVDLYLDGVQGASVVLNGWDTSQEFNIRLAAMAREAGDTATAVFDNFSVETPNVPYVPPLPAVHREIQYGTDVFAVADDDLLTGLTPTISNGALTGHEGTSTDATVLTNGAFGAGDKNGAPQQIVTIDNGTILTYTLPTDAAPDGYDVTEIQTFAGWNDRGRDDQRYVVSVAFTIDPEFFVPLDTVQTTGDFDNRNTAVYLTAEGGGLLASNVAAVQFAFLDQENNYVGYRELDVFGVASIAVPEPSTLLLGLTAAGLLVGYGIRRNRHITTTRT